MSAPAFNYESLQGTAQGLIDRFGRPANLVRAARTTTATVPPGKTWLAPQGDADADAAPAQDIAVTAVFLSLVRTDRLGQVVEAKTQSVLIGAELDADIPEELGPDWTLEEADRTWEVLSSKPLKPGPLLMLTRLELAL